MKKHYVLIIPFILVAMISAEAQKPAANFTATNDTSCAFSCINFNDLSTNNPTSWSWSFPGAHPSSSTVRNPQNICYLTDTSYRVTLMVSNADGTDALMHNFIPIYPNIIPPVISQSNDTLSCTIDPSYVSYQWYNDSIPIPGATNPVHVVDTIGFYGIYVTNVNGCSIRLHLNIPLDNDNQKSFIDKNFSISPNPATDRLLLYSPAYKEPNTLTILNIFSAVCFHTELKNPKSELDISSLAPGLYLVEVRSKTERWVEKFVKQ